MEDRFLRVQISPAIRYILKIFWAYTHSSKVNLVKNSVTKLGCEAKRQQSTSISTGLTE